MCSRIYSEIRMDAELGSHRKGAAKDGECRSTTLDGLLFNLAGMQNDP